VHIEWISCADPSIPLPEQIRKGNYGYVNEHYTPQNFTLTLTGNREVVLFDPNGFVSSKEMIRRMKRDGFVPATIDDALAMGTKFPDRQKQNPIVSSEPSSAIRTAIGTSRSSTTGTASAS
jgi:hypothetical protein